MRIRLTVEVTRSRPTDMMPERETQLDAYVERAERQADHPTIGFRSIAPDEPD